MFEVNEQEFERVGECRYLGSILTENNITVGVNQRIIMANRTSYGLKKQLYSLYLGRHRKCALYKTLVKPMLDCGSESSP
jgi:hypothetical protein